MRPSWAVGKTTISRPYRKPRRVKVPFAAQLVYAIKKAPVSDAGVMRLDMVSYTVPHRLFPSRKLLLAVESLMQSVIAEELFGGVEVDSGAPIPIKRVEAEGTDGRTYRFFAATFPLLEPWGEDGALYVPFREGYARASVDGGLPVRVDSDEVHPLTDFTRVSLVFKGEFFTVWYDFPLLGIRPPKRVAGGFTVEPVRGPLRNRVTYARTLEATIRYHFAVPRLPRRKAPQFFEFVRSVYEEFGLKLLGGIGWKGLGTVINYDFSTVSVGRPEDLLFAKYERGGREYYVLLRPMPSALWRRSEIVYGALTEEVTLRITPPYYVRLDVDYRRKDVFVPQLLPGCIVSTLPEIRWEVV